MIMFEGIGPDPSTIYWPGIIFLIILLVPLTFCFTVSIVTGSRVRRAGEGARWPESLIDSDEELAPRHHLILDFIAETPANEGITRRQVLNYMSSKGVPIGLTKITVNELVGAGYLEEISIGRYVPGEVQRKHRT
jgi:hypothetical protein